MNGQRGQLRKLVGRALVSLVTTVVAAALLAPAVAASPIGDAEAAMMAAWDKAGGATSPLGARKGDVYPIGGGFALEFDGGKMFYTTDTGAKYMYGPILDKYEALGGAATSDLGFPTINEVPGLAGPDSRAVTFSAGDKPVIFWTPDHGAFVVRGALNAAWDRLGSSGGVLGAPIGDETYDGEVTAQKFTGGAVSWNRKTKEFATEPAALADQLKGLQVAIDPGAAINMAWRAAGGVNGPLGVKQGGEQPIGGDGIVQAFVGGKVFFSPATGANALESDILAKYESLGGPVGSDLGFPIANESDGGIGPSSRIATFSAADKPVVFWTPDHGAFVVRGAMKAAWDKLRGPTGKLGAPVGDQTADGDSVSQKFTGGKIAWNRANNTFTTDPANLAPLLSGLQVAGQNQPSGSATAPHAKKFTLQWWWLVAAISALLLAVLVGLLVLGWWRRRNARREALEAGAYQLDRDFHDDHDVGYDADGQWPSRSRVPRPTAHSAAKRRRASTSSTPTIPTRWTRLPPPSWRIRRYHVPYSPHPALRMRSTRTMPTRMISSRRARRMRTPRMMSFPKGRLRRSPTRTMSFRRGRFRTSSTRRMSSRRALRKPPLTTTLISTMSFQNPTIRRLPRPCEPGGTMLPRTTSMRMSPPKLPRRRRVRAPRGARRSTCPLPDPYQVPDGYPVKASAHSGLYYLPDSALYHDTLAEIWFASEDAALASGFVRAD